MRKTLSPAAPESRFYLSQRLRLHYLDWGNPSAPALILQHGGLDHAHSWDRIARALCGDFHVLAPDLRGHGDSAWSPDGHYALTAHVYDLAQLIHQECRAPVAIVGHSLGGNIALRFAGLYPGAVSHLIAIEGIGSKRVTDRFARPVADRMRDWISAQRASSGRLQRKYATFEEALARMMASNDRLEPEFARHLALHGVMRNEDQSFSWKFDNYSRTLSPIDLSSAEFQALWSSITCPTMLVHGTESWAADPEVDGNSVHFANAQIVRFDRAGHWPHHDRCEDFLNAAKAFLRMA